VNDSDAQQLHQSLDNLHELVLAQGERVQRLRLEASRIKQKAGLSTERAALKAEAVQPARPLSPSTASVL
jgi:hypothetical protein